MKGVAKKRIISFPDHLSDEDIVDVKLFQEGKEIVKFSLNYRGKIGNKWYSIYRLDSYHKFLHEQKFWISDKPLPIPRDSYVITDVEVNWLRKQIYNNYKNWRELFEMKKLKKGDENGK